MLQSWSSWRIQTIELVISWDERVRDILMNCSSLFGWLHAKCMLHTWNSCYLYTTDLWHLQMREFVTGWWLTRRVLFDLPHQTANPQKIEMWDVRHIFRTQSMFDECNRGVTALKLQTHTILRCVTFVLHTEYKRWTRQRRTSLRCVGVYTVFLWNCNPTQLWDLWWHYHI